METGQVFGDIVSMAATNPSHFGWSKVQRKESGAADPSPRDARVSGDSARGYLAPDRRIPVDFAGVRQDPDDFVSGFAGALRNAFYKVNDLQLQSDELTKALAVRPETVDVHDVTIAAEKARIALLFTKSIVERVTQAYKELLNMR